jgi:3-dehydroquinate synthase
VQSGGLADIGSWAAAFPVEKKVLVVADENTAFLFGKPAVASLQQAGFTVTLVVLPPGEASKSLTQADVLYAQAIVAGLDRNCPVLALGGGVVGDLAGFVAATYLRGVPFLQVPTTLLSQVDSSVGGKVAVNHHLGKNLIGAFYQPLGVLIDPQTLLSLPQREFASGMAEVIKYGLIADAEFCNVLASQTESISKREPQQMAQIVAHCCRMKAAVVERDEQDLGERMLLNFGHTAGHAIEASGGFERFTHGEGVALGMIVATRLSELEGMVPIGTMVSVRELLIAYGLPTQAAGLNPADLIGFMGSDKKREGSQLRWILLKSLGRAKIQSRINILRVEEALQAILQVE